MTETIDDKLKYMTEEDMKALITQKYASGYADENFEIGRKWEALGILVNITENLVLEQHQGYEIVKTYQVRKSAFCSLSVVPKCMNFDASNALIAGARANVMPQCGGDYFNFTELEYARKYLKFLRDNHKDKCAPERPYRIRKLTAEYFDL